MIGNLLLTLGFLFVGPLPFIKSLPTSISLIQGSSAFLGTGYAMLGVSTFARSQSAAIMNGFSEDQETYMFVSSEKYFTIQSEREHKQIFYSKLSFIF